MNVDAASRGENPLSTLANVIVAPNAAFASIRERPRWVVPFVVVSVVYTVASYLIVPAMTHAMSVWYPAQMAADPRTASLTPDQAKQVLGFAVAGVKYGWLAAPVIVLCAALAIALVLLVVTAAAHGSGGYGRLFALALNVGVISFGIGSLVLAAIVIARGAESFASPVEITSSLPSLAWLWPAAPPKMQALLAGVNPFAIWSFVLLALGTSSVARVSRAAGFVGAAIVVVGTILIGVAAAR
jgi:hypothetical protein